MPLYEYQCQECGQEFEKLRSISDRDSVNCPTCGSGKVGRKMSLFSWYMGYNFLKWKSEKSPPAPTDAGYHPEWDEAYKPL